MSCRSVTDENSNCPDCPTQSQLSVNALAKAFSFAVEHTYVSHPWKIHNNKALFAIFSMQVHFMLGRKLFWASGVESSNAYVK